VTPNEPQAAALLKAEEMAKAGGNPAPVYEAMKEIVETWRELGITEVLFARADAPKAHMSQAVQVEGVNVNNYFDILAEAVILKAKEMTKK
jgi:hypothetical protein